MDFISTKEAADKWKISRRRVIRLAAEGRIRGAVLFGKSWMIPADAGKPADGRMKRIKPQSGEIPFRFPFYMNEAEDGFLPPLCDDEKILRRAQLDFLACDFEKSKTSFEFLRKESSNSCIQISALFFLCYLSASYCNGEGFEGYYQLLASAIAENNPNKQEMELLRPYLLGCLTLYKNAADTFCFDREYKYAPSAYPLLYILSSLTAAGTDTPENGDAFLKNNEINSMYLEKDGHYYEAQMMHVLLFTAYYFKANEKAAVYHLKKVLHIAYEHHFIYPAADIFVYYSDLFCKVLKEYPDEFAERISRSGNEIHQSFSAFMLKQRITDLYAELSKMEYQFIFYACENFTNRKVAEILQLSERTVANRYAEIYDKLNIKGKPELKKKLMEVISKEILPSLPPEMKM